MLEFFRLFMFGGQISQSVKQVIFRVAERIDSNIVEKFDKAYEDGESMTDINEVLNMNVASVDWTSRTQQDRALLSYVTDGSSMLRGKQHMSIAVDKSRICGLAIANGCFVFPDNTAFWCCPQVRGII